MKTRYLILILSLLTASFSFVFFNHAALYVIGGSYVLEQGQVLEGDLNVVFAQVTLEDGALVTGNLHAIASDIVVKGTMEGSISSWNVFGFTVLIPEVNRFQVAQSNP